MVLSQATKSLTNVTIGAAAPGTRPEAFAVPVNPTNDSLDSSSGFLPSGRSAQAESRKFAQAPGFKQRFGCPNPFEVANLDDSWRPAA